MDKTFNFFKSKAKKQNERPRNNSKSNSSKASYSKQSHKGKDHPKPPLPSTLTKKQRDIREAIQSRFQKSRLRAYIFERKNQGSHRRSASSHSSDYQQFKKLRKMAVVDLKDYHKRMQDSLGGASNNSSQEKKKFNLKFKLRDKAGPSNIIRTEGNEVQLKTSSTKDMKTLSPARIATKGDEWKFLSIQIKDDPKQKTRKDVKIKSHRSYNIQQKAPKIKTNYSVNKYLDKMAKPKSLNQKFTKTRI